MFRSTRQWPFLLALVVQNAVVYWGHYFRGAGIPWDFSMAYYAMVAFWTAVVREGVFPQWLPFQQMGYPFALQIQSGMNYLPLWVFPALDIPYTLHAAIVFQCLHVLMGAIGMFLLARHVQPSRGLALVAAIAFQFFGGFYSNAEHVDIVRAFAFAPWLLYVFSLDHDVTSRLPRRHLFIPPVLYLFLTGSYPGNVIAGGVIIPLFLALQIVDAVAAGVARARVATVAARVVGLSLLGCGMAALHLGPLMLFRDQFVRGGPLLTVPRFGLGPEHLPGLFLSNASLPGEISMTSTYVSLPVLVLACFTPKAAVRKHWVYVALGAIAALMTAGDRLPLGPFLTALVPVLGLSRFPSSDYRVFVAIPVMLLALSGLKAVATRELPGPSVAIRSLFCVAWVCWGLSGVYDGLTRDATLAAAIAAGTLVTTVVIWRGSMAATPAVVAISLLIAVDALRVLPTIPGWYEVDRDAHYVRQGFPAYARNRGRRLASSYLVRDLPTTRPPRTRAAGFVRWSGYLDGSYLANDLTPNVLRASSVVAANEVYDRYMLREWSPLLLNSPPVANGALNKVQLSDAELSAALAGSSATADGAVRQTRYGINDITYHVSLPAPRLLIENEVFFPGWRARLSTPGADTIEAVEVNGIFRAWRLPAGEYTMAAQFAFPHLLALRLLCLASLLLWLALWFV